MKIFYFDTEARIRAWIEAKNEEEAMDKFIDAITSSSMKIDVESTVPDSYKTTA